MPTGKELLEEQNRQKQQNAETKQPDGTVQSVENTEAAKIKAETAKLEAQFERNAAQQKLDAQLAGFISVDEYKNAIVALHREQTEWTHTKAMETSTLETNQAQFARDKDQLQLAINELKLREANLAKREVLCKAREDALGQAQKIEYQRKEVYNSDLEMLKRNFVFIRNRLVRLCNQFGRQDGYYAEVLAQNIDLIDSQGGQDGSRVERNFDKVLPNLKVIVNDSYNAVCSLMSQKNPPDTNGMVGYFDELSQNEAWRLITPEHWISE